MEAEHFEFARPLWLLAGAWIPLFWLLFGIAAKKSPYSGQLEKFIDKELLPYLLVGGNGKGALWRNGVLWSVVFLLLTVAMAEPRWNYREVETYSKDQSLVLLLDLSQSMDAEDLKPSRLKRAKQKIEDLLIKSQGLQIGLIAFAADAHMITPLTDDKETLRRYLPTLDTSLIAIQGSRLTPALEMASSILKGEPGSNKAILLISDGGFEDGSAIAEVKKLADQGIVVNAMGVGTPLGAPIKDADGNFIKKGGAPLFSKLDEDKLREISQLGKGIYFDADHSGSGEDAILSYLESKAEAQKKAAKKIRIWEERFYLLIFPAMAVLLFWFRKGFVFACLILFAHPMGGLEAGVISDAFKNHEERGKDALDKGDYQTAASAFQDPYRKGVAYYREGNFAEAEKQFRLSHRGEVARNAGYNLGNSLAQQGKLKEAAAAYEEVLKQWPDFQNAKDNLEYVKRLMEEQKNNQERQEGQNQEQDSSGEQNQEGQEENKRQGDGKSGDKQQENEGKQQGDGKKANGQKGKQGNEEAKPQGDGKHSNGQEEKEDKGESGQDAQAGKESEGNEDGSVMPDQATGDEGKSGDPRSESGLSSEGEEKGELSSESKTEEEPSPPKESEKDVDADLWLNRMTSDPKQFLKNKFYIESKLNGTREGIDPW